jgi:hypothetical protein
MSDTFKVMLAIALSVFVTLTVTDFKIARAIKSASVMPTQPAPAPSHQKCDTIIRSGDTIFMYIKNK